MWFFARCRILTAPFAINGTLQTNKYTILGYNVRGGFSPPVCWRFFASFVFSSHAIISNALLPKRWKSLTLEHEGLDNRKCIFVGMSCAVYREWCRILTAVYKMFKTSEPYTEVLWTEILYLASRSKNPAPSNKTHDRPTDLFFRLNTLCTHLSGSNLWYLNELTLSWVIMQNCHFVLCTKNFALPAKGRNEKELQK